MKKKKKWIYIHGNRHLKRFSASRRNKANNFSSQVFLNLNQFEPRLCGLCRSKYEVLADSLFLTVGTPALYVLRRPASIGNCPICNAVTNGQVRVRLLARYKDDTNRTQANSSISLLHCFNLKPEVQKITHKSSLYLTENTPRLHCEEQSCKAILKFMAVYWKLYEAHKYTVWADCVAFWRRSRWRAYDLNNQRPHNWEVWRQQWRTLLKF
jgi:hypothetical protein